MAEEFDLSLVDDRRGLAARFWQKVKVGSSDECWQWESSAKKKYGEIFCFYNGQGRNHRAHRVSYAIHKGPIPSGLDVMHSCDNPRCVNPNHLSLGTRLDNMRDCAAKGRIKNGIPSEYCPKGHQFTPENTRYDEKGHRRCIACKSINLKNRYWERQSNAYAAGMAAGLAKGESSARAEFVKDLRKMADHAEQHDVSYLIIHRRNLVAIALDRAADALALVRKGV